MELTPDLHRDFPVVGFGARKSPFELRFPCLLEIRRKNAAGPMGLQDQERKVARIVSSRPQPSAIQSHAPQFTRHRTSRGGYTRAGHQKEEGRGKTTPKLQRGQEATPPPSPPEGVLLHPRGNGPLIASCDTRTRRQGYSLEKGAATCTAKCDLLTAICR